MAHVEGHVGLNPFDMSTWDNDTLFWEWYYSAPRPEGTSVIIPRKDKDEVAPAGTAPSGASPTYSPAGTLTGWGKVPEITDLEYQTIYNDRLAINGQGYRDIDERKAFLAALKDMQTQVLGWYTSDSSFKKMIDKVLSQGMLLQDGTLYKFEDKEQGGTTTTAMSQLASRVATVMTNREFVRNGSKWRARWATAHPDWTYNYLSAVDRGDDNVNAGLVIDDPDPYGIRINFMRITGDTMSPKYVNVQLSEDEWNILANSNLIQNKFGKVFNDPKKLYIDLNMSTFWDVRNVLSNADRFNETIASTTKPDSLTLNNIIYKLDEVLNHNPYNPRSDKLPPIGIAGGTVGEAMAASGIAWAYDPITKTPELIDTTPFEGLTIDNFRWFPKDPVNDPSGPGEWKQVGTVDPLAKLYNGFPTSAMPALQLVLNNGGDLSMIPDGHASKAWVVWAFQSYLKNDEDALKQPRGMIYNQGEPPIYNIDQKLPKLRSSISNTLTLQGADLSNANPQTGNVFLSNQESKETLNKQTLMHKTGDLIKNDIKPGDGTLGKDSNVEFTPMYDNNVSEADMNASAKGAGFYGNMDNVHHEERNGNTIIRTYKDGAVITITNGVMSDFIETGGDISGEVAGTSQPPPQQGTFDTTLGRYQGAWGRPDWAGGDITQFGINQANNGIFSGPEKQEGASDALRAYNDWLRSVVTNRNTAMAEVNRLKTADPNGFIPEGLLNQAAGKMSQQQSDYGTALKAATTSVTPSVTPAATGDTTPAPVPTPASSSGPAAPPETVYGAGVNIDGSAIAGTTAGTTRTGAATTYYGTQDGFKTYQDTAKINTDSGISVYDAWKAYQEIEKAKVTNNGS